MQPSHYVGRAAHPTSTGPFRRLAPPASQHLPALWGRPAAYFSRTALLIVNVADSIAGYPFQVNRIGPPTAAGRSVLAPQCPWFPMRLQLKVRCRSMSERRDVTTRPLFILGAGRIARALVRQLLAREQYLRERYNLTLPVAAVANSRYLAAGAPYFDGDELAQIA